MKFSELGLKKDVLELVNKDFDTPTEIQERTIPLVLQGKDVIAGSATGSGKTLAFGSGILNKAVPGQGIQALVLTPTRELAEQVARFLMKYSKTLEFTFVYGGVSFDKQVQKLKTADVVVGTPGRTLDHIGKRTINLSKVKILVLDEADRMFDMGFYDDVRKIIKACPQKRQTLLFSATITPEVGELSKRHMVEPVTVLSKTYVDPSKLKQVYYDVPKNLKISLLFHLLKKEREGLVMVFCNSRLAVNFVDKNLKKLGVNSTAIHGGFEQNRRSKIMRQFKSEKVSVLVCTDVAARGLDIEGVSHVYNYDIPREPKQYIHRIGRTARAGSGGIAVNILSQDDHPNFQKILNEHNVNVERMETPRLEQVRLEKTGRRNNFNRPRKRHFRGRGRR